MLNAAIIEQDAAMEELVGLISSVAADIHVLSRLNSVGKAIGFLSQNPPVDLIFSTINLPDGLSFEIFNYTQTYTPVIFVAEDGKHLKDAIDFNCISYLLKPVDPARLRRALVKYKMLSNYFSNGQVTNQLAEHRPHRQRMIVKSGKENIALPINDIVLFHTEHRSVHVTDQFRHAYTTDKSLSEIEQELDHDQFFRVNRQYIVNLNFIHSFKTFQRVKLLIELTVDLKHTVVVSQEMAPQFRQWIARA
jgi:DNA-binding LytR/AlgR family response regulator